MFWLVQAGALRLLHRGVRRQRLCALGCAALLELGGALAGCGGVMLAALALQLVLGVLLLFGVQRCGNGVAMLEQSLSLYRYLRGLRAGDAEKLQGQASQYFYRMLPYAEALGLGRRFAAAFSGVTLEPCGMCACAIGQAHLDRVVFGAYDAQAGCCGSVYRLTEDPAFPWYVPADGGVLEEECRPRIEFGTARRT